jgi:glycolate oxidase
MSLDTLKKITEEVVGKDWVFHDPVDRYPYGRDIVTDGLKRYTEQPPELVILPESTEQIQKIVVLANEHQVPLYIIGTGSTILVGSLPAKQDAVTLDLRRMQKMEIDQENLTVSVEPGVIALQLSGEFKKIHKEKNFGYRPYFGGCPGGSCHIATNIFTGQNKLAGYKYCMGINCISGLEMVLPDGTLLKTSSLASGSKGHWAHGPGPDFSHLPFFSNGAFGIVTKITWQLYPIPETYKTTWAYFKDFKSALKAVRAIMQREIGKGLSVMDCWTHSAYSSETIAESRILAKCSPKIFLGFSTEGTKRTVTYQTKIARQIIKEAGGRVAPEELVTVYRGHEMNSRGWQQGNSSRILKHLGRTLAAGTFLAVNEYEEFFDRMDSIMQDLAKKLKGFADHPEPGFGEFAYGPQTYLSQFGHTNNAVEFIYAWDHRSEENTKAMIKIGAEISKVPDEMGAGPLVLGRDPSVPEIMPNNYRVAKNIKDLFDPNNIMAPGIGFLEE